MPYDDFNELGILQSVCKNLWSYEIKSLLFAPTFIQTHQNIKLTPQ